MVSLALAIARSALLILRTPSPDDEKNEETATRNAHSFAHSVNSLQFCYSSTVYLVQYSVMLAFFTVGQIVRILHGRSRTSIWTGEHTDCRDH